jgi:hypothetical protein
MIQYAAASRPHIIALEYWMPAFAGMTAVGAQRRRAPHHEDYHPALLLLLPLAAHEIEIAAFVGLQDRLIEQMRVAAFGPIRRRDGSQRRLASG